VTVKFHITEITKEEWTLSKYVQTSAIASRNIVMRENRVADQIAVISVGVEKNKPVDSPLDTGIG